jgi:NTE family protein
MSDVTYGFDAYLPLPKERRKGIALCFSGGGYRAALFHLGAVRRLNELGVLSQVDTITSVSGGSIFAAQIAGHLAQHGDAWGQPGSAVDGFEDGVAAPTRKLATQDIRTRAVFARLKPWNWFDQNAQIDTLAATLAKGPAGAKLADLGERPRFVICATDVCFRTQWTFDTGTRRLGEDRAGWAPLGDWTIARAAASSSCLPVAFAPMRVHEQLSGGSYDDSDRAELVEKIDLTDGGIYDNLGLEPVWRDHAVVLVSDAAPAFKPEPHIGRLWSQLRYVVTLLEQSTDVRKRWLIAGFIADELEGTFWGIGSKPTNYGFDPGVPVYSDELIRDFITQTRIDLDPFSDGERAVLENHGYLMADVAVRKHASQLVGEGRAPQVPFPDWMDESRARRALAESHKTKAFSRGWRRW